MVKTRFPNVNICFCNMWRKPCCSSSQSVKHATLTGLEQTSNTSYSSQNRNWLWGKNKLETTKMDNQSDGKKQARRSTDPFAAAKTCSDCTYWARWEDKRHELVISNRLVRCKNKHASGKLPVPIKKEQNLEISVIWQFYGSPKLLSEVMPSEVGAQFGVNWFNGNEKLQMLLWTANLNIFIHRFCKKWCYAAWIDVKFRLLMDLWDVK